MALDNFLIEIARAKTREESRWLIPCRGCGERNRIALGGDVICYATKMNRATELDHIKGSGSGPAAFDNPSNDHRIANEGARLLGEIPTQDLCDDCGKGIALRLGIALARLEVVA